MRPILQFCYRGYFYICDDASIIDNGPVAALERPLPLFDVQRRSTTLNVEATTDVETHRTITRGYLPNLPRREVGADRREGADRA